MVQALKSAGDGMAPGSVEQTGMKAEVEFAQLLERASELQDKLGGQR